MVERGVIIRWHYRGINLLKASLKRSPEARAYDGSSWQAGLFKLRVSAPAAPCGDCLMDKQAWIAITLSVVGLVVWQLYFAPKYLPTPAPVKVAGYAASGTSPAPISSKGEVVVDQRPPPRPHRPRKTAPGTVRNHSY